MDPRMKSQLERAIIVFGIGFLLFQVWHNMARRSAGGSTSSGSAPAQVMAGLRKMNDIDSRYANALGSTVEVDQPGPTTSLTPPVEYTASNLRDPMASLLPKPEEHPPVDVPAPVAQQQPTPPPPPKPPAVALEGILWTSAGSKALIDGQVYSVGDHIKDATIVSIDRGGVVVDVQGTRFAMTFPFHREGAQ